jgi:hypothetical protein
MQLGVAQFPALQKGQPYNICANKFLAQIFRMKNILMIYFNNTAEYLHRTPIYK